MFILDISHFAQTSFMNRKLFVERRSLIYLFPFKSNIYKLCYMYCFISRGKWGQFEREAN